MASPNRRSLRGLLAVALLTPLLAQASSSLAVEMGCYNCHGALPRGDAPPFERLMPRLAQRQGDAETERHLLDEFREIGEDHGIEVHQQLSDETARRLMHWLIQGDGPQ